MRKNASETRYLRCDRGLALNGLLFIHIFGNLSKTLWWKLKFQVWFQNRRSKDKKVKTGIEYGKQLSERMDHRYYPTGLLRTTDCQNPNISIFDSGISRRFNILCNYYMPKGMQRFFQAVYSAISNLSLSTAWVRYHRLSAIYYIYMRFGVLFALRARQRLKTNSVINWYKTSLVVTIQKTVNYID